MDVRPETDATRRAVEDRTTESAVVLSRTYPTDVADLFAACTDPERLPRWFAPVRGELRLGGRFEVEGNAGGTITACDPPHGFDATWELGGQASRIEVRCTPEGDGARLDLTHVVPHDDHWRRYGPGAVGLGWDLGLLGLAAHLGGTAGGGVDKDAAAAWFASPEAATFLRAAGRAWERADVASGVDDVEAAARAGRTIAFYTGAEV